MGYVLLMHVDVVEEDSKRKMQEVRTHSPEDQWDGLDTHLLAKHNFCASSMEASNLKCPLLSYNSRDVVHILHSGHSAPFGKYWYGQCSGGAWGFVNPKDFDEIKKVIEVESTSILSSNLASDDKENYLMADSDSGD